MDPAFLNEVKAQIASPLVLAIGCFGFTASTAWLLFGKPNEEKKKHLTITLATSICLIAPAVIVWLKGII